MADGRTTVEDLRAAVRDFVAERSWEAFHDPKNLAMSLAIEAAELMEHFQWVRSEQIALHLEDPKRMEQVRDEAADVACYLFALCNALNLDLSDAVAAKMEKNRAKYPAAEFRGRYEKPGR